MSLDEFTDRLGDLQIFAIAHQYLLNNIISEANACSRIKRIFRQFVFVDMLGSADRFSNCYQEISRILIIRGKGLHEYQV